MNIITLARITIVLIITIMAIVGILNINRIDPARSDRNAKLLVAVSFMVVGMGIMCIFMIQGAK